MKDVSFPLGQLVITTNAAEAIPQADIEEGLRRHAKGDWGDLDKHDWNENELSLKKGYRLLSSYKAGGLNRRKFWIITEADRSVTTVFLPEELSFQ